MFFNRDQDYPGEDLGKKYANEVKDIIDKLQAEGKSPGCFIAESLQSCGGQVIPPPNYLSTSSSHVFTNSVTTNFFSRYLLKHYYEVESFDWDQTIEKNANVTVYGSSGMIAN